MKREVKFRIFYNGEMIGYADKFNLEEYMPNIIITLDGQVGAFDGCEAFEPVSVELMQYTGLKDKNGVEIYHKDICHYKGINYEIIMINDGSWHLKPISGEKFFKLKSIETFNLYDYIDQINVIGNIYEKPNLIN